MRKVGLGCLVLLLVLTVTGCFGGKVLSCSIETNVTSNTIDLTFNSNDEVVNIDMEINAIYTEEPTDEELNSMCADLEGLDGVVCEVSKDDESITMIAKIDLLKADDDTVQQFSYGEDGYEASRADAEEDGYTCK